MFFLNQKPLDFDWCNVGLCDWSKVQQMYSSFKQRDCLTAHCTEGSAASNVPAFTVIVFAVGGSILLLIVLINRRPRPLVIFTFRLQRFFEINRNRNYSHTGT